MKTKSRNDHFKVDGDYFKVNCDLFGGHSQALTTDHRPWQFCIFLQSLELEFLLLTYTIYF